MTCFANFGHQFVVFVVICGIFAEFRTVVMVFCGFFARFFRTVVSTFGLLGLWRCHFGRFVVTNQCSLCSNLHFSCFSRIFCFFRSGSNMVAFCAKVDGTWQALSQRRLRCRVTGLRPNLSFSLFLPPFSSLSPFFSFFLLFYHSFHTFPSSLLFFHLFSTVFQ